MLIVVARYVVSEGHDTTVARLLRKNAQASRAEPGCLEFSVYQEIGEHAHGAEGTGRVKPLREVRRILLPRTPVNRGNKRKCRGFLRTPGLSHI